MKKTPEGVFLKIVKHVVTLHRHVFAVVGIKNSEWQYQAKIDHLLLKAELLAFRREEHRRKKLEIVLIEAHTDAQFFF